MALRLSITQASRASTLTSILLAIPFWYPVKVVVSGTDHYERFLRGTIYRIPGVRQTRTTFGLRALKRTLSVDPLKAP